MPQMDIRRKYTYKRGKKNQKKQNFAVAALSGIFPWKGDTPSDAVRKTVMLVSVLTLVFVSVKIYNHYFGKLEANPGLIEIDHSDESTVMVDLEAGTDSQGNPTGGKKEFPILSKYKDFYETNSDFVGYVAIEPYVSYPVAQSKEDKEFDYYLNHNFNKVATSNGCIFADKGGQIVPPTDESTGRPHNILLHGHNLKTRQYFQPLTYYRGTKEYNGFTFLKENPIVTFDTLYEQGKYKIFSVFQTNIYDIYGEYYDYLNKHYFNTKDDFFEYVTEVLDRSQYHTNVDLQYGDELLTLSTCDFSMFQNMRVVVVARRIRDGEDPSVDTSKFISLKAENGRDPGRTPEGFLNYKMFESYYRAWNYNKSWVGVNGDRPWDTSIVEGLDEFLERTGY